MFKRIHSIIVSILLAAFIGSSIQMPAFAQIDPMPWMPRPGIMVGLSPEFSPAYLKGIVIHPENALKFDFIIYKGDKPMSMAQKRAEYTKLTKYFLASLAIPDDDQWVNLSPYEKDRIIKDDFGKTIMGRDLLAQDYLLKQITASLIYPEDHLGKEFWRRIYSQAQERFGTTNIPVNAFNKVWILPDDALIYEKGNTAYVLKNHLRVMLEEDYLALAKHPGQPGCQANKPLNVKAPQGNPGIDVPNTHSIASQIIRQIILPELQKEVNEGANFAPLRQVYSGMLLATWFKRALKQSLLAQIYANKSKTQGIEWQRNVIPAKAGIQSQNDIESIYQCYLQAYKKGVFNFIKEDADALSGEAIPRKYFSGGDVSYAMASEITGQQVIKLTQDRAMGTMEMLKDESGDDMAQIALHELGFNREDAAMANTSKSKQSARIILPNGVDVSREDVDLVIRIFFELRKEYIRKQQTQLQGSWLRILADIRNTSLNDETETDLFKKHLMKHEAKGIQLPKDIKELLKRKESIPHLRDIIKYSIHLYPEGWRIKPHKVAGSPVRLKDEITQVLLYAKEYMQPNEWKNFLGKLKNFHDHSLEVNRRLISESKTLPQYNVVEKQLFSQYIREWDMYRMVIPPSILEIYLSPSYGLTDFQTSMSQAIKDVEKDWSEDEKQKIMGVPHYLIYISSPTLADGWLIERWRDNRYFKIIEEYFLHATLEHYEFIEARLKELQEALPSPPDGKKWKVLAQDQGIKIINAIFDKFFKQYAPIVAKKISTKRSIIKVGLTAQNNLRDLIYVFCQDYLKRLDNLKDVPLTIKLAQTRPFIELVSSFLEVKEISRDKVGITYELFLKDAAMKGTAAQGEADGAMNVPHEEWPANKPIKEMGFFDDVLRVLSKPVENRVYNDLSWTQSRIYTFFRTWADFRGPKTLRILMRARHGLALSSKIIKTLRSQGQQMGGDPIPVGTEVRSILLSDIEKGFNKIRYDFNLSSNRLHLVGIYTIGQWLDAFKNNPQLITALTSKASMQTIQWVLDTYSADAAMRGRTETHDRAMLHKRNPTRLGFTITSSQKMTLAPGEAEDIPFSGTPAKPDIKEFRVAGKDGEEDSVLVSLHNGGLNEGMTFDRFQQQEVNGITMIPVGTKLRLENENLHSIEITINRIEVKVRRKLDAAMTAQQEAIRTFEQELLGQFGNLSSAERILRQIRIGIQRPPAAYDRQRRIVLFVSANWLRAYKEKLMGNVGQYLFNRINLELGKKRHYDWVVVSRNDVVYIIYPLKIKIGDIRRFLNNDLFVEEKQEERNKVLREVGYSGGDKPYLPGSSARNYRELAKGYVSYALGSARAVDSRDRLIFDLASQLNAHTAPGSIAKSLGVLYGIDLTGKSAREMFTYMIEHGAFPDMDPAMRGTKDEGLGVKASADGAMNVSLKEVVSFLESEFGDDQLQVSGDFNKLWIKNDHPWDSLQFALYELINNGLDAQSQVGKVQLNISSTPTHVKIEVTNTGTPVDFDRLRYAANKLIQEHKLRKLNKTIKFEKDTVVNIDKLVNMFSKDEIEKIIKNTIEFTEADLARMRDSDLLWVYGLSTKTEEEIRLEKITGQMGIGLQLVKANIDRLKGEISYERKVNRTIATILLPRSDAGQLVLDDVKRDQAMLQKNALDNYKTKGGIDLNSAHLTLRIKRDGRGVPLSFSQQDLAQISQLDGLVPVIISIKPASQSALFAELIARA